MKLFLALLIVGFVGESARAAKGIDDSVWKEKQILLSRVINMTMGETNMTSNLRQDRSYLHSTSSHLQHMCRKSALQPKDEERIGCCSPTDVRHLLNVMYLKGKFIAFTGSNGGTGGSHANQKNREKPKDFTLPMVKSVKVGHVSEFRMGIEEITDLFPSKECKSVFKGTLHVIGRGTTQNVYHTVSDNFMPLVAQILRDYYLAPEYLHLPRIALTGFQPGGIEDGTPHLRLMKDLMTAGTVSTNEADGMCFSRVIWGYGGHVMYFDGLVALRRLAADFARNFAMAFYNISVPSAFQVQKLSSSPGVTTASTSSSSTSSSNSSSTSSSNSSSSSSSGSSPTKKPKFVTPIDSNDTVTEVTTAAARRDAANNITSASTTSTTADKIANNGSSSRQDSKEKKNNKNIKENTRRGSNLTSTVAPTTSAAAALKLRQVSQEEESNHLVSAGTTTGKQQGRNDSSATPPVSSSSSSSSSGKRSISAKKLRKIPSASSTANDSTSFPPVATAAATAGADQRIETAVAGAVAVQTASQNRHRAARVAAPLSSTTPFSSTSDGGSNSNSKRRQLLTTKTKAAAVYANNDHGTGNSNLKNRSSSSSSSSRSRNTASASSSMISTSTSSSKSTPGSSSSRSGDNNKLNAINKPRLLGDDGKGPLKVVVFTRGSSGKGRTFQGEEKIIDALRKAGAMATICCDFSKTSLSDQLAYGIHADVIIGIHGAALVHGVFAKHGTIIIELKTLYGYRSPLFALVADSRIGTHGQVDVRSYWKPGGHKPIDDELVKRTLRVLDTALLLRQEGSTERLKETGNKGDFAIGHIALVGGLNHPLGPLISDQQLECKNTILQRYRDIVDNKDDHCQACEPYRRRLFVDSPEP